MPAALLFPAEIENSFSSPAEQPRTISTNNKSIEMAGLGMYVETYFHALKVLLLTIISSRYALKNLRNDYRSHHLGVYSLDVGPYQNDEKIGKCFPDGYDNQSYIGEGPTLYTRLTRID